MAVRATEVFKAHPEVFDADAERLLAANPAMFGGGWVKFIEKVHDSISINDHPGPCVIISASGMCESGRVLHHLKHTIENPHNTVLIAGFQAEHTLGRRIVERRPEVRILGRPFKLRAEVVVLNGLSSHADHGELLRSLGPLAATHTKVRLVHGEPDRAEALAAGLRSIGFDDVGIPDRGETVVV
jgi:metallo-beta-lactamase family protein